MGPECPRIVRVGYLFREDTWGKGFATELLTGLVASIESAEAIRLVAGVGKDNPASARALTKAGFQLDPAASSPDTNIFVYQSG